MNSKDIEEGAIDISEIGIGVQVGDYVCPCCGIVMLSLHHSDEAVSLEVQCPSCGYKLDPTTDQTKHASKLTPKITEEMIADEEDEDTIFETVEEDSGRIEDNEETDYFAEEDKRDEESLRRRGYRILSSN
jgi:predicted RNA-binding Zn-ribbon protein involved in translation (DUF1610 family)